LFRDSYENIQGLARRFLPTEIPCTGVALVDEILAESGLGQDALHRRRDFLRISRVHQQGSVAADFLHRAPIRRHDGATAGHGFQERNAEPFVETRKDERDCGLIERDQVLVGNVAQLVDVFVLGGILSSAPAPISSGMGKIDGILAIQDLEHSGENPEVLGSPDETHVEKKRFGEAVLLPHCPLLFFGDTLVELRFHSGMDHRDSIARNSQRLDEIAFRGLRHSDHPAG